MRSGVYLITAALTMGVVGSVTAQGPPTLRLTLEDALSKAVETSHRIAEARARESAAQAGVAIRESAERPTVTASAVQPAFSARVAVAAATSHLLVAYICIQIGAPRALMTSSTLSEVWLERICRWFPALAALATAISASA